MNERIWKNPLEPNCSDAEAYLKELLEHDKIMAGVNLGEIMKRLINCSALLFTVDAFITKGNPCKESLRGVGDLLDGICRDLLTDIEAAEDYDEEE